MPLEPLHAAFHQAEDWLLPEQKRSTVLNSAPYVADNYNHATVCEHRAQTSSGMKCTYLAGHLPLLAVTCAHKAVLALALLSLLALSVLALRLVK